MNARPRAHRLSLVTGFIFATALVLSWLGGCTETAGPSVTECDTGCGLAKGLTVSDPQVPATGAGGTARSASARAAVSVTDWQVFVSLPPGTNATGTSALIRNRRTGDSVQTAVIAGGFDPVSVGAIAGDTVEVFIDGILQSQTIVRAARRPIVVRTEPPPRKRDQPFNAAIVIVFSEPIDSGSLTSSTVQLIGHGGPVPGSITPLPGGVTAIFRPSRSLAVNSGYKIIVTTGVRDLEGLAPDTTAIVPFSTGGSATGAPASLTVHPDTIWIPAGTTYQLTATVRDAAGAALFDQPVSWFIDTTLNASISQAGVFTPRAAGNYVISASVATLYASAYAGVRPSAAESLSIAPKSGKVATRDTIILAATVRDSAGAPIPGTVVTWRTSDSTVATIAASGFGPSGEALGTVTGVKPGNTTITATIGTAFDAAAITVTVPHPGSVTVSPDTATLLAAETIQLNATVRDSSGKVMAGQPLSWRSINPVVARVDSTGLVTAASKGTVGVIVTSSGVSDTALITVAVRGSITVTTTTTGDAADLDTNGYAFRIDGQFALIPIAMNGSFTIDTLRPGAHVVTLGQIALNCAVSDANPRADTLGSGGKDTVAFHIACAPHATIVVTATTTGIDRPSGYNVVLDSGSASGDVGFVSDSGSVTFPPVAAGAHTLELINVPFNCATSGPRARADTVAAGATDTVAYQVNCASLIGAGNAIAFASKRDSNYEIYVRDDNGLRRLTYDTAADGHPTWSRDGSRIAFSRTLSGVEQIHLMNADGSGVLQLTSDTSSIDPAWSPDGSKIAFTRIGSGAYNIFVMNPDGTGRTQLTTDASKWPAWSPDGAKIAFETPAGIAVINADGSGRTQLTTDGNDHAPSWSPDGGRIALANAGIVLMNADGSGRTQLKTNSRQCVTVRVSLGHGGYTTLRRCITNAVSFPAWSPDGLKLAYSWSTTGCYYSLTGTTCLSRPIVIPAYGTGVMTADGTGAVQVTSTTMGPEGPVAWRP